MTSIGDYAFYNCSNLTSIDVDNENEYYSSINGVLFDKNITTIVNYPVGKTDNSYIIPNNVTSIVEGAFSGCSSLTSVNFPSSIQSIAERAFDGCNSLSSIYISDLASWCNIAFDGYCSNPLFLADHFYLNGEEINDLVIPSGVTKICMDAFSYFSGFTSVTIPNSVTIIEDFAFCMCPNLSSVTLSEGLISIGGSAFESCNISSISIPNSVISIGDDAFGWNTNLTTVTIGNSVTTIPNSAFTHCSSLISVYIPESVTNIGSSAFYGCSGLTSVDIPNSVRSIGANAFSGCTGLTYIVSLIENPFSINGKTSSSQTFDSNIFNNARLYVPVGTINKYKYTQGWQDFINIEEGTGPGGDTPPAPEKCATPTISYLNGKVRFACETEGVEFIPTVTCSPRKMLNGNELEIGGTFTISVYAVKEGYYDSDVATKIVTMSQMGDIDGDGQLTVTDVTSLVNAILGK